MIESDTTDFAMDGPGPASGPSGVTAASPAPVIVIEHRSGGVASKFLPPLLILLVALAITSYQRRSQVIRPISTQKNKRAVVAPGPVPVAKTAPTPTTAPDDTSPDAEKSIDVADASSPTPAVSSAAGETPAATPADAPKVAAETKPLADAPPDAPAFRSPFELDQGDGLKTVDAADTARPTNEVPAIEPIVGGGAADGVSKDDILRDIQREAREIDENREKTKEVKARSKEILLAETLKSINEKRVPFRNELRKALKDFDDESGPEIDRLCDEFGRETPPEVHARYTLMNRRGGITANLDMPILIARMREIGLPEPVILDWICTNKIHRTMNSRGGPKDEDQVRIRGAKLLLRPEYNITTPKKPTANGNR